MGYHGLVVQESAILSIIAAPILIPSSKSPLALRLAATTIGLGHDIDVPSVDHELVMVL